MRLLLPRRVVPPPFTVPRFTVENSWNSFSSPIFERDGFAFVGEILWVAADNAERVEVVAASEARGAFHHCVRFDDAAFAEFDFVADDGEGVDCDAVAEAGGGRDGGARVDFTHSASSLVLDVLKLIQLDSQG